MNTIIFSKNKSEVAPLRILGISIAVAISCSLALPYLFAGNRTIGFVDAGIWQLLLIAFIVWAVAFWLCTMAFSWLLARLELPAIATMVQHFNKLSSWQKLKLYFLLFACLLSSAILTITAII